MRKLAILFIFVFIVSCGTETKDEGFSQTTAELSPSELKSKSLEELRIIRNEIFAKKGYVFKSEDLKKHFSTFEWYKPKHNNVDSLLSTLDKQNIQTIHKIENQLKNKLERRSIRISDSKLSEYKNAYDSAEKRDKQFISKLFRTIDQYKGRMADTTILTIGNIDGIGKLDTISTHVFALDNAIYVESKWIRDGQLIWSDSIKNPYLWVNDDDIFAYDLRHPWVTFTIAVNYELAELSEREDYSGIDRKTALQMAKWYIKRKNLKIDEEEYIKYFDTFNGQLFIFGDPEFRHELLLWYEPKKQFILYYAP